MRRHQLSRPGVRHDLSCDIVDASHVAVSRALQRAATLLRYRCLSVDFLPLPALICAAFPVQWRAQWRRRRRHSTLFVGDVSLSAATKSFVKRRRRLSQSQSQFLPLSLFHLQFLSQPCPLCPFCHSTSPLDCCNCLSFRIVSCAKAQSQKLAQLIHEISRFISPNSRRCHAPPHALFT